jgi:uncharacterized alkaline shock family protein YloU
VVRQVVAATAGVAGLAAGYANGMNRVMQGHHPHRAIDITVEDGVVSMDVYIVALPNVPLLPLGQTLQHEIHRALAEVIGMPVRAVNIHISDVQDPVAAVSQ